jgi:hypothetical protein
MPATPSPTIPTTSSKWLSEPGCAPSPFASGRSSLTPIAMKNDSDRNVNESRYILSNRGTSWFRQKADGKTVSPSRQPAALASDRNGQTRQDLVLLRVPRSEEGCISLQIDSKRQRMPVHPLLSWYILVQTTIGGRACLSDAEGMGYRPLHLAYARTKSFVRRYSQTYFLLGIDCFADSI